ncbi:MAG: HEPN domain-containing protein [Desulfobacteraceae bacterium]|jgi:HEPN domain-containing protein|nr:HEPN domain-containing protein [Desulfobacteraceae bacterium]
MDRVVDHWVERSEYDLDTAKAMLDTGRYLYVGYMCQQTVEKLLKAMIAHQNKENLPIHNLNRLAEVAEISNLLSSEQVTFLAELTPFCIEARYGDFKESLSEIINREKAGVIYRKTRVMFEWLYQKIS